ncbi:MAG: peptide deformylase, partial [Patescibacteria group bacterium]
KKELVSEGCLSVRWKYGLVKRATTATVRALNAEGNEFVMSGKGLLAQIFQHEVDHLNGVLFIDTAIDVEDLPPSTNSSA